MYHDLIIHPSRIELVERVFSPGTSNFREKKISSYDLDFKVDTNVIESGKHYESLKSSLKTLLEPFEKELSILNIVILPSYVQYKVLKCGQEYTDLQDYVNWEISKITTDDPDHYRYGTYYDSSSETLILALIRKSVGDFFLNIMKDTFDENIEFKIGCRYSFSGNRDEFIHTDKKIRSIASFGTEIESPQVIGKKSAFISLSFLVMISILAIFYYLNPVQFKKTTGYWTDYFIKKIPYRISIEKKKPAQDQATEKENVQEITPIVTEDVSEVSEVETNDENIETVIVEEGEIDKQTVDEAETTPVKTPEFWGFVTALSQLGSDSVVFVNGTELRIHTKDAGILSKAEKIDAENIYNCEINENRAVFSHPSFSFPNSRWRSNYKRFVDVKDSFNIKPIRYYQNIFRIEPVDKFFEFIKALEENNVEFKKFIISPKDGFVMFTVYFG